MPYCGKCGTSLPDGALICSFCGAGTRVNDTQAVPGLSKRSRNQLKRISCKDKGYKAARVMLRISTPFAFALPILSAMLAVLEVALCVVANICFLFMLTQFGAMDMEAISVIFLIVALTLIPAVMLSALSIVYLPVAVADLLALRAMKYKKSEPAYRSAAVACLVSNFLLLPLIGIVGGMGGIFMLKAYDAYYASMYPSADMAEEEITSDIGKAFPIQ